MQVQGAHGGAMAGAAGCLGAAGCARHGAHGGGRAVDAEACADVDARPEPKSRPADLSPHQVAVSPTSDPGWVLAWLAQLPRVAVTS